MVSQGCRYCDMHDKKKAEGQREYDGKYRDKRGKRFYHSREWQSARKRALARDKGIDLYLYMIEGRVVMADTVHHIIELSEDYGRRCDIDNLISLSGETHDKVSAIYKDATKKKNMQRILRECIEKTKKM